PDGCRCGQRNRGRGGSGALDLVAQHGLTLRAGCGCQRPQGHNGGVDSAPSAPRAIVLLGSTGSVGTQAVDIIRRNPGRFRVVGLAAGGGRPGLLASPAVELGGEGVAVATEAAVPQLRDALRAAAAAGGAAMPKILAGPDAVAGGGAWPCDILL